MKYKSLASASDAAAPSAVALPGMERREGGSTQHNRQNPAHTGLPGQGTLLGASERQMSPKRKSPDTWPGKLS